jgi:hypothetical protein
MANTYILVQNQQTVILGPIGWKQRYIQSEITDLVDSGEMGQPYYVPPDEIGYINLNYGFEIFPVNNYSPLPPTLDPIYQYPIGPTYTYANNVAAQIWSVGTLDIPVIKTNLKALAASVRYNKEIAGTSVTLPSSSITISLSTDRTIRSQTVSQIEAIASSIASGGTVIYKTSGLFLNLTYADCVAILTTLATYVQTQFNWEQTIDASINDATTLTALEGIEATINAYGPQSATSVPSI